jgi:hypothetical protein
MFHTTYQVDRRGARDSIGVAADTSHLDPGKNWLFHYLIAPYNERSTEVRELLRSDSDDGTIQWSLDSSRTWNNLRLSCAEPGDVIRVQSQLLRLNARNVLLSPWILLLVAFLLVLYLMVRYVAREIFLLDVSASPRVVPGDTLLREGRANILLLTVEDSVNDVLDGENSESFDLARESWEDLRKTASRVDDLQRETVLIIRHLENRMHDIGENRKKLRLIESLVYTSRRRVVLVSTCDPLADFRLDPEDENGGVGNRHAEQRVRWQALLSGFSRVVVYDRGDPDEFVSAAWEQKGALRRMLLKECQHDAVLQAIGRQMNAEVGSIPVPVMNTRILEYARSHYHRLWSTCSEDERRVLLHVALGGFVSCKNKQIVGVLLQRGLLDRSPHLHVMNTTFGRFILSEHRRGEVHRSDSRTKQTGWSIARVPVLLLLVSVVLFLYLTQQEILTSSIAFISTASALLPALFRLIGTIASDKGLNGKETE